MRQNNSSRLRDYREFAEEFPEHFPSAPKGGEGISIIRCEKEILRIEKKVGEQYCRHGSDPAWAEVGLHYEDPYCRLLRDAIRFPEGREAIHHRVLWKCSPVSGVVMLPRFEGQIVLLRHYRHPILRTSLEFPRGGTTCGEDVEETVRKELREEIGAAVKQVRRLGHMLPINSLLDSGVDLFLVELEDIGLPESKEGIEKIILTSASEVRRMVAEGEITDASTICAFAQADFQGLLK